MTRLEFTMRELGELYDFYREIRKFRIVDREKERGQTARKELNEAVVLQKVDEPSFTSVETFSTHTTS